MASHRYKVDVIEFDIEEMQTNKYRNHTNYANCTILSSLAIVYLTEMGN